MVAVNLPAFEDNALTIQETLFKATQAEIRILKDLATHPKMEKFLEMVSPNKDRRKRHLSKEVAKLKEISEESKVCADFGIASGILPQVQLSTLDDLRKLIETRDVIAKEMNKESVKLAVGEHWPITRQNIALLTNTLYFVKKISTLPYCSVWQSFLLKSDFKELLDKSFNAIKELDEILSKAEGAIKKLEKIRALSDIRTHEKGNTSLLIDIPLSILFHKLKNALAMPEGLNDLTDYLRTETDVYRRGLGPIVDTFKRNKAPFEKLCPAYEICVLNSLLKSAKEKYPDINRTVGFQFEEIRESFRHAENKLLGLRKNKIAYNLISRDVKPGI